MLDRIFEFVYAIFAWIYYAIIDIFVGDNTDKSKRKQGFRKLKDK